jgi:hypothetical protein
MIEPGQLNSLAGGLCQRQVSSQGKPLWWTVGTEVESERNRGGIGRGQVVCRLRG